MCAPHLVKLKPTFCLGS